MLSLWNVVSSRSRFDYRRVLYSEVPGGRIEKFVSQGHAGGRQYVHVLQVLYKSEGREESLFQGATSDEILVQHGHNDEGKGDFI